MDPRAAPEQSDPRPPAVNPYASPQVLPLEAEPPRVPEAYPWISTAAYSVIVVLEILPSRGVGSLSLGQMLFLTAVFGFPWIVAPVLAFCFQFLRRRNRTFVDSLWSYLNYLLVCMIAIHVFGMVLFILRSRPS